VAGPRSSVDHSHRTSPSRPRDGSTAVPVTIALRPPVSRPPAHDCDESPLAGFTAAGGPAPGGCGC
jgi:hypothetical protein